MNNDQVLCLCGCCVEWSERVIHHCQLTKEVFGVAHSRCNLRANTTRSSLFCFRICLDMVDTKKSIFLNGERLSAIAKNDETYLSFSLHVPMERFKSKTGQHVELYHFFLRFLNASNSCPEALTRWQKF